MTILDIRIHEGADPRLSAREIEVLTTWLVSDSKSEASRALYLSMGTVNTHFSRIRAKYSAVGRTAPTKAALLARALQDGFIDIDEL
ncbi:LuxR family transcriptional regulator [Rhodococcus fascians]|nr:LuxR family transcriptional regulator [Rhodococcus fascians]MBY4419056.1 LuxR family transcriptional regulator [Rhodococcus fascians]